MQELTNEIIKLLSNQNFDYDIVNNFIKRFYTEFIHNKYYIDTYKNSYPNQYYPDELQDFFNDYYFLKNKDKVEKLINICKNGLLTDESKKVLLCQNLIFHNDNTINDRSRLELKLVNMFLLKKNLDDLNYSQILNYYKGNHSTEDINMILTELSKFSIYLNENEYKIFGFTVPYRDENTIKRNFFDNIYTSYNGEDANTINGRYGEYLVFNELRKDDSNFNIWVSKDVGDGFGYDIMSISKDTYKTKIIEVKTTVTEDITPRRLSKNEAKILTSIMKSYDIDRYDYELIVVSLIEKEDYVIYTCKLNKELSKNSENFIFDVMSNKSNDSYITESYLDDDYGETEIIHISIPEELKKHNKIYVKK